MSLICCHKYYHYYEYYHKCYHYHYHKYYQSTSCGWAGAQSNNAAILQSRHFPHEPLLLLLLLSSTSYLYYTSPSLSNTMQRQSGIKCSYSAIQIFATKSAIFYRFLTFVREAQSSLLTLLKRPLIYSKDPCLLS